MMLLSNKTHLEETNSAWTSVPSGGLACESELLLEDKENAHSIAENVQILNSSTCWF